MENTNGLDLATSPQPESPGLCPAEDCPPLPAERTETDETQAALPTPDQLPPTDSPQPLEEPEEEEMSPARTQSTRRQLLNSLSSPSGGCRESANAAELPTESSKASRKTKSSAHSPLHIATAEEEPPLKKTRGDNVATVTEVNLTAHLETTHSGWLHPGHSRHQIFFMIRI